MLFTVIDKESELDDALPAASVAVAVNPQSPLARFDVVIENAPLLSAVPVPKSVVPL